MASSLPVCYENHENTIGVAGNSVPCGIPNSTHPFVSCCVHGDTCLSDGFCSYTHSQSGGSGYYIADCTDPTFSDVSCPRRCNDYVFADVVYDNAAGVWHCCSFNGSTSVCSQPTNVEFNAPAPADLVSIQYIPLSGTPTYPTLSATSSTSTFSTSSASSTSATSSLSPSSSPSSQGQSSNGLSAGASAGIGVGVALGILAVVGVAALLVWQRRRQRRNTNGGFSSHAPRENPRPPVELSAKEPMREMGTSKPAPAFKEPIPELAGGE